MGSREDPSHLANVMFRTTGCATGNAVGSAAGGLDAVAPPAVGTRR